MRLDAFDLAALERIPFVHRVFPRESTILQAGEAPSELYVVVDGVAARMLTTRSGERQIVGLLLPGDVFDWPLYRLGARVASPERATLEHAIVAIGGCTVGMVRFQSLRRALEDFPPLAEAFERRAVREEAIAREWMVNIGVRRAGARLGHLICEIYARYESMGLTQDDSCPMPITQIHLAEALGLSSVHVNRELQALRGEGLLRLSSGVLSLADPRRLERMSEFSGVYLTTGCSRRMAPVRT